MGGWVGTCLLEREDGGAVDLLEALDDAFGGLVPALFRLGGHGFC